MPALDIKDGHTGPVVGRITVDGTLTTEDEALRREYEDLTTRTEDGQLVAPYEYNKVADDGTCRLCSIYVRAGDPEFLTAVKWGLGGGYVPGSADEPLPRLDHESYDAVPLSEISPDLAKLVEAGPLPDDEGN